MLIILIKIFITLTILYVWLLRKNSPSPFRAGESLNLKQESEQIKESFNKKETFPSVSLSVKNPKSSKLLITMILFQILSNVGIIYLLYLGMG